MNKTGTSWRRHQSLGMLAWSVILLTAAGGAPGIAADWAFSPSLRVSEVYDSNINFQFRDRQGDFISSIKPGFLLAGRMEQDQVSLECFINGIIYADNNQLDRVETFNYASWIRQWSPRFSSDVGAAFVKTTALESQLQEAGIRAVLADQYNTSFRAKVTYLLTEALSVALGGSTGQAWYPNREFNLPDSRNAAGNLTFAWKRSDFDTFGIETSYSFKHYSAYLEDTYVDSQDVQFFRPGLYWEHAFSETASILLGAGYRRTQIEVTCSYPVLLFIPPNRYAMVNKTFTATTGDDSYDFWVTLKKRWSDRLTGSLSAGRDQYSDASGNTYDHMYAGTNINYALTELTNLGLDLRYDYNVGIDEGLRETNYFRVTPSVERKLAKDLTLRLSGSYQYQTEQYASTETADRFLTQVELVWQLPRLLAGK